MRLARRMGCLGTESAFEVFAQARALEAQGRRIIHLELGEPDFDTPAHIKEAAAKALRDGHTHYVPPPGIAALREAVAEFLARWHRLSTTADRVIITPGAKPIMWYLMLATCEEGDEVVCPDPGFPMYASIATFCGARPVPIPLREQNQFRLDPEELASLVSERTKLIILNSPHNPCGSVLTREEAEAIAEIVLRHDLLV
ncbi:MAG: aminotransferase class I/II-fold pyridoxal phosphate-dependent enzyme, partial [Gemmatimonadetes bacterium]|nr:aminotransferase class I/II-fold pyridoxal phosphate-dependent enzyme [Gemmatimonadota bacterium]